LVLRPSSHIMYTHKHCIIGAGFCGLGVAGAFTRHNIPFDVLEADNALGGNWYHGVYETVHIISSRKTTEYSDYPMPADYPDFPSAAQMLAYLNAYADHWGLREHIQLGTAVSRVAPHGDQWAVTLANGEQRIYGGVVVANGHHWDKRMPSYPGTFAGELLHSKDYKSPEQLRGKRVLVIGGGNSACDIAVEAARFALSSHISLRRGYWFMPKTMFGRPTAEFINPRLPLWAQRLFLRTVIRVIVGRYEDYGLQHPDHKIFEHHPTINTELLHGLKHGRITAHPDVARYDDETVQFVDGQRLPFDLVICATGYYYRYPFLAPGIVEVRNNVPQLIGGVFAPEHKNIYFFGTGQARYGAGPLISAGAEMLCAFIAAQRRMRLPVGAMLRKLGQRPPRSVLIGPGEVLRNTRQGQAIAGRLPLIEKLLVRM
jgi:hypothetical protein